MKRTILSITLILALAGAASAQSGTAKSRNPASAPAKASTRSNQNTASGTSLSSSGSYAAKSASSGTAPSTLTISDPTIRTLNARANGAVTPIGSSGIVGMPRRAYGFGNGKLTFATTGATTSGTQTGNGSVGTGSSLGTLGSNGPAMLTNGKSPYAGWNMWGNARNLTPYRVDTHVRTPGKE